MQFHLSLHILPILEVLECVIACKSFGKLFQYCIHYAKTWFGQLKDLLLMPISIPIVKYGIIFV
jgi:hypothetical protein